MWHIEAKLQQELKEAGKQLFYPAHIDESIDELLLLLDQIQKLLSEVDESPGESMLEALEPSRKGLIQSSLLKHSDIDVKVSVAACLSEITRITAPGVPYSDDQMRDIFQVIVSSFQDPN
uniref:sister chromatid cohesion protein PDS5-like n=1 Tax=Erigeron canadensis TaxID=72917 RepID=UPI001CB9009B|nr:sister chromatid cohesion protein PDS5-like [Erigeron canadensis]XP_043628507.1 sister chromatid cohesion protein PDS5-like [Erigeron canadensis]